ncbi:hypothetical protein [Agrobacterium sp. LAD9]|uniref:hypothetical protein n=1 Tax=Agrobacterium sp. LAD9 TaxID=2055153 RepID=UPI000D1E9F39|nr:hypothetical protein [Agrobacterium sp. LAD9]
MTTLASIVLYALSVLAGSMIGIAANEIKNKPENTDTETLFVVLIVALFLFFGLATALQVAS